MGNPFRMYLRILQPNVSSLLNHPWCEAIPVLQPSRFYPCPSERNNFKAVRGLDILKFCLALCLQNLWFISLKKLATFVCCGRFTPTEIRAYFLRILNWSAKECKTLSLSQKLLQGRCRPGEGKAEVKRGGLWEKECGV
jgi:hypothetical protein